MEHLFARLDKIKEVLRQKAVLLLLDYDGTLAPIVDSPGKALMPDRTRELLRRLSDAPGCKIGIISGRSLKDLKAIVGLRGIVYAGNHGLEIEGPKIKFESRVAPRLETVMRDIALDIRKKASGIKGVLVEDKGLTLSVHYRLVDRKDLAALKNIVSGVTGPYAAKKKISVNPGKKVYEIRPPVKWDKGKVTLWLLARQQFVFGETGVSVVYIGDDVTDEDAFKALRRKGLTVFVGKPGDSLAQYYLKDTEEVARFLRFLTELKHS